MNENLSESPEIFQLLVEQVQDYAIFMLDTEGRIRSWNEGARRIKGYEASDVIGKHFSLFYPEQDKKIEKPQLELRLALQVGRYEEEGWRIRKDGSRFWANVIITPLFDKNRNLTGFVKVTRDLTQKRIQEEGMQRLLESEERFRFLVDQVKDYAIFILDARGNVRSWNQGAMRLKGYIADEVLGKHFSIFYTQEDIQREHPAKELSIAVRDGRYEEEGWRIRKDGSRFWANVVITALWDTRGNLTGFAKVTRDLTVRKAQEDALRRKNEELESFAHTLSHDLRAPLRSIASFAGILKTDVPSLSETEQGYLDKIQQSAKSMEGLLNDILKLSQISLAPLHEESVSLDDVLSESLVLLDSEIKKTQAQIDIQGPLPFINANRTLLIQIFSNLVANALKFVRLGEQPLIEIYHVGKTNGECEIHVTDNGIGIPDEFLESIFNVFDRGASDPQAIGTGVGLAIVKKAVERLGGSVSVKSKPGEGSDFIVTLGCRLQIPPEPFRFEAGLG